MAQANLITKTDFDAKLSSLTKKITSNKIKHLIVENELKKLETFDSIYFLDKSYFEDDGTQNYLVFQIAYRYFKTVSANGSNITFNYGKIVNIYIVYEIERSAIISSYPTLENCLFCAVKLTKHVDVDLYKYSGNGIRFDRKGYYSIGNEIGRNVIIFGVDMSSFPHIDGKEKDILILGKGPTQGLDHTLTPEKIVFN